MTQIFDEDGNSVPVTVVQAGPCVVTQVKTAVKEGYNAVQLGYGAAKKLKRPQMGHFKAANSAPEFVREFRIEGLKISEQAEEVQAELHLQVGHILDVTNFEVGDEVAVTGTSKGKGFAGTIKRHNFSRGPKSHGSRNYREPGSIGSGFPERVFKGLRMAGQMGHEQATVRGLKVAAIDATHNMLVLRGAVPGPKKGFVIIRGRDD
jgi:large subunit ribosomal protein L3